MGSNGSDQPPGCQGQEAGNHHATPHIKRHEEQRECQYAPSNACSDQGLRLPESTLMEPLDDCKPG